MKQNKDNQNKKQRSGFAVMCGLIGMIKPLLGIMCLAILMGCAGNLMATFLTILGGYALLTVTGVYSGMKFSVIFTLLVCFAVARGILRYAEQASNHYIAFKLLARIRHQVFDSLRRLAPAKLDGAKKGNLISIITSDIELLEVFYAHTISPIAIAVITSVVMTIFLGRIHPVFGVLALFFYVLVGAVIPVVNGRIGAAGGKEYREAFGALNTCVLDNLYGLEETLQYGQQEARIAKMAEQTGHLETVNGALKRGENLQRVITDGVILFAGVLAALVGGTLAENGSIPGSGAVIAVIALASSFGPTAALSALSNNLNHTLASGNRVLDILEEKPLVEEVTGKEETCGQNIHCDHVSFAYANTQESGEEDGRGVLRDFTADFTEKRIHGILGKSGCGKSTLLKLLMRFYEPDEGVIAYDGTKIGEINTAALRGGISYVTQETFLFHDTVAGNLKVAKEDATEEELERAARAASIHDLIMSLPDGYETKIAELGSSLSGGERQRLGIARAFLHDADILFLDEPTSNIDSLNEGMILRSLKEECADKTILMVSHRKSTMGIADDVLEM
ncbi:amino acid ABC transporter ATP-binding/permease protein [Roseburia hominis]|jgi:ATP-binding cassette subfamily C protein|uniref:ABC transporter ATP-binding protein n=1 Tax=Roseburia hominis TaxID=301301 RepID=A0A395VG40_9FIRM|nr:ABC transporter ATP-binding protein [Roseburia hominis]RGS42452.1 ABC transporter ATP-binding protein [Roseburia hominis]